MTRIILEVDETIGGKWNALSDVYKEELTRQFEQIFLQLFTDNDMGMQMMGEPLSAYKLMAKKIRKEEQNECRCCLNTGSTDVTINHEVNDLKPTVEDIKLFYADFQVDMSDYRFNRDEANER